jgi:hypothetical protein
MRAASGGVASSGGVEASAPHHNHKRQRRKSSSTTELSKWQTNVDRGVTAAKRSTMAWSRNSLR